MDNTTYITVERKGVVLGTVYFSSHGAWVAELSRTYNFRSQSFRTVEQAIFALLEFKPEDLNGNTSFLSAVQMADNFLKGVKS